MISTSTPVRGRRGQEAIDCGRNRGTFQAHPGQHDRQQAGMFHCRRRQDTQVNRPAGGQRREHGIGHSQASQPGRRCGQPSWRQQSAGGEEPQGDLVGIHPGIAAHQIHCVGDVLRRSGEVAGPEEPVIDP